MVLVDGDVAYAVDSYMTWITCMLREIELITLSEVHLYRLDSIHDQLRSNSQTDSFELCSIRQKKMTQIVASRKREVVVGSPVLRVISTPPGVSVSSLRQRTQISANPRTVL